MVNQQEGNQEWEDMAPGQVTANHNWSLKDFLNSFLEK